MATKSIDFAPNRGVSTQRSFRLPRAMPLLVPRAAWSRLGRSCSGPLCVARWRNSPGWRWVVSLRSAWARLSAVCSLLCLIASGPALAQVGTAAIYGKVTDQQAGAMPGVTVTITNAATGLVRSTLTDAAGDYQILAV